MIKSHTCHTAPSNSNKWPKHAQQWLHLYSNGGRGCPNSHEVERLDGWWRSGDARTRLRVSRRSAQTPLNHINFELEEKFCLSSSPASPPIEASGHSYRIDARRGSRIIQNYAVLVGIRRVFCLVQLYRSALAVGAYALLITAYYTVLLQRGNQI